MRTNLKVGESVELLRVADETARLTDALGAMTPTMRCKLEVARAAKKIEGLTARETIVLRMIRQGCSSKMIAAEFATDISSVERHQASLMRKLNAENVADAVRIAIYSGLGAERGAPNFNDDLHLPHRTDFPPGGREPFGA